jgi:hypothetical protein
MWFHPQCLNIPVPIPENIAKKPFICGFCLNKKTNRKIAACMPMHTFGFPIHLDALLAVCDKWNIPVVEDAAESLGSYYKGKHTGTLGKLGVFSSNGNKVVTSGGGGAIVTNDEKLGVAAKYLTTTAKKQHSYEFYHDELGYNYRMPNLNAALACAQLEQLDSLIENKRILATEYKTFFATKGINFRTELPGTKANYWLMCVELENKKEKESFLRETNQNSIMTRPIWQLIFKSQFYSGFQKDAQINAMYLENRIVNTEAIFGINSQQKEFAPSATYSYNVVQAGTWAGARLGDATNVGNSFFIKNTLTTKYNLTRTGVQYNASLSFTPIGSYITVIIDSFTFPQNINSFTECAVIGSVKYICCRTCYLIYCYFFRFFKR